MPQECTKSICRGTPDNLVDECFLTRDGTYKRLNGAECPFCPAGTDRVNTGGGNFSCVADKCNNIAGIQTAAPTGTTINAAGACTCTNGGTNPPTCTPPTVPTTPQCSDSVDNDSDGKIDFTCPTAGGTSSYIPAQSKGRQSATFTAAQGPFEEMAPSGQAKRPTIISARANPGDTVKLISVSNNKFSISVGKGASYERTCDYGSIGFANTNDRTLEIRQLRNINNNGIIAPP